MSTDPPSSARGLFRFGLATLLAAMLLCISVAGWLRDRQANAREQAALDAIAKENVGVRITRRSERDTAQREAASRGATASEATGTPAAAVETSYLDAVRRFLNGDRDPIVVLMIEQIPSDATRRKVLDLPYLERLWIFGNIYPEEGKSYPEPPSLEAIYGGTLPELPPAVAMPDEPPALSRSTPLEEAERVELLKQIGAAWDAAKLPQGESLLVYAESDDPNRFDVVHAIRGQAIFRAERVDEPQGGLLSSRVFVVADDRESVVQRRWETGAWRLEVAGRSLGEDGMNDVLGGSIPDARTEFLGMLHGDNFLVQEAFDAVERFDDGSFLLRRKKGLLTSVEGTLGQTEDGWIVVGPAPAFELQRSDLYLSYVFAPGAQWRTDILDRDEKSLPVRQSTWFRTRQDGEWSDERSRRQVRFAFVVDPVLPADLFQPDRQGGDFFTAQPPPAIRWWYVTGALSIAAFVGIGAVNARNFARRRSRRGVERNGDRTAVDGDR